MVSVLDLNSNAVLMRLSRISSGYMIVCICSKSKLPKLLLMENCGDRNANGESVLK